MYHPALGAAACIHATWGAAAAQTATVLLAVFVGAAAPAKGQAAAVGAAAAEVLAEATDRLAADSEVKTAST